MRRSVAKLLLLAGLAVVPGTAGAIFGSPINGGCYIAAANDCRVHTDPILINVASGESLEKFTLSVGGAVVYDWRSDVSNPPVGDFTPTIPAQDLGARCGETYTLSIQGRDSGDPPDTVYNLGVTTAFTCPSGLP
jgi:hypothetical protein